MPDAAELKALVKKLQGSTQDSDVISILNNLKNNFEVNEAILRESKAGLAVGKLRSHSSKLVSDLAKEIVKKWKGAVEKAKLSNGNLNGKDRKNSTPGTPLTPTGSASKMETRSAKIDGVKGSSGDSTRDKCMTLIYDALAQDSGAPIELIQKRAQGVENAVYNNLGGTTAEYKAKIRSLFVNLKDKNNPALRESIVSGELSVEIFSKMTSADMASQERKAADQKIKEENFHKSLAAEEQQAETDAFQCSRCKQRKCRYRQAQTRSADEPMTTFVTCVNCNNRWKFS
ncbi:transcription elongation factor [Tricholoma matsutake]|nr:transcription elongation factor [Tricholoma matsutake 945]